MSWLRNKQVDLLEYLPAFLQSDVEFKTLTDTLSREHERIRVGVADLLNQVNIETATWHLSDWESLLGLTVRPNDTYEQRRNRIILRLNYKAAATKPFMEALADRYIKNGSATLYEDNEHYTFNFKVNADDIDKVVIDVKGLHEGVDLYKPAHLGYGIIILPKKQFGLNAAGRLIRTVIPDKTWTETRKHVIFDAGLNAAGIVSHWTETHTETERHTAYTFGNGTINGRLKLNVTNHSSEQKDIGGDVTEKWLTFTGNSMNSRASPTMNDAPTKTNTRTYHKAVWAEVISYHGHNMNGGGGMERSWTTSITTTRRETSLHPYWSLNRAGTRKTSHQDIGKDVEMTDVLFTGGTITGGHVTVSTVREDVKQTARYKEFTAARMNTRRPVTLNDAPTIDHTSIYTSVVEKRKERHTGAVLNAMHTNGGTPSSVTRMVHIPVWRQVVTATGGTLLNASKHSTTTETITHTIPGRTEKVFSPKYGMLLNDHAALGYLRI